MKVFTAIIAVLTLGVIGYFIYEYTMESGKEPLEITETPAPLVEEGPIPPAPTKIETPPTEEEIVEAGLPPLPDLESSDAYLDTLFEETDGWRANITSKHLVRRAVTAVDLISRDENPNSQWHFLQPTSPFKVVEKEGWVVISEENYDRYQPAFDLLDKIPVERAAIVYQHLYPLLLTAYDELGNGDDAFAKKFDQTLQRILDFKPPEGDIQVAGKDGTYIFTDPDLESLSALEKGLIRIGPSHTKLLQEKISAFRAALSKPTE